MKNITNKIFEELKSEETPKDERTDFLIIIFPILQKQQQLKIFVNVLEKEKYYYYWESKTYNRKIQYKSIDSLLEAILKYYLSKILDILND